MIFNINSTRGHTGSLLVFHYLVESIRFTGQSVSDSEGASSYTTVKPMRRVQQFVDSGHVQNLSDTLNNNCYFIRAEVLPSMWNDPPKHVHVCLSCKSGLNWLCCTAMLRDNSSVK